MATKSEETRPKEATEVIKTNKQVVETKKQVNPLWWVLGTVLVIFVLILLGAAAKRAFMHNQTGSDRFERSGMAMMDGRGGRGHMMMDRMNDDNTVSGVVTKIDGSTLTVAGNGATKQVTINASTEYYGAAKPVKVNDSVRIQGTTSGETFTADQIMISRSFAE